MRVHDVVAVKDGQIPVGLVRDFNEGRLPFTVRVVRTEEQLVKAVRIRQAAYARHMEALAAQLHTPEAADRDADVLVLLAESKLDGSPLGTMRIQTNNHRPLVLEQSVQLPSWLHGKNLVEATRLGVDTGHVGSVVKIALFKAFFLYCVEAGIDWMVITARPPLDRQYDALSFQDLFPGQLIAMRHVGDIPHRVMALDVDALQQRWAETKHRLYHFFFNTRHADIDLSDVHSGHSEAFERPRGQLTSV